MATKIKEIICMSGILVLMTGCAAVQKDNNDTLEQTFVIEEKASEVEETESEDVQSEQNEAANVNEDMLVSSDIDDDIENEEDQTDSEPVEIPFTFVDVFGEQYETTVNPNVPKTIYDNSKFSFSDGRTYYEDDEYMSRQGVDVSKYQGNVDWTKVKESGMEFAIIRIGFRGYGEYGDLKSDQYFRQNIEGAQAVGLDVGVYFFAQAVNEDEAVEEAEFVLNNLEGYDLQLPIVYDPESILDVPARTDDVTPEQFTLNSKAFCERIREAGYEPMIYSNMLWEAFELDMEQLQDYSFWYADYEEYPQTPYRYCMWQYSNTGRVPGIKGETDLNLQFIKRN